MYHEDIAVNTYVVHSYEAIMCEPQMPICLTPCTMVTSKKLSLKWLLNFRLV